MSASRARRLHTQAIRDVLAEGPATVHEIAARTWHLFPAGPCVAKYRYEIDGQRRRDGTIKTGYSIAIEEQHRWGARRLIGQALHNMCRRGSAIKEGDRYRLV